MVLLMVVLIGIFVPCLTVAFSLFWVMTLGFESNLPTPLDSAAVMKKSTAKFGERCPRNSPLVGAAAPRLTFSGNGVPLPLVPVPMKGGGIGELVVVLVPTAGLPAITLRPLVAVPAKPSCTPIS